MVLTEKQKYEIVIRSELNQSSNQIALEMDININTVYLWLRKYSKDGNIDRKIGSGRKKKLSSDEELVIINEIKRQNIKFK